MGVFRVRWSICCLEGRNEGASDVIPSDVIALRVYMFGASDGVSPLDFFMITRSVTKKQWNLSAH